MKSFLYTKEIDKDVLWGIQNKVYAEKMNGIWPYSNLKYIPNGFHWNVETSYTPFEERENIILTVARNGTPPKKTDILMNGFAAIADKYPDWKLVLAGTVEDSFKPFVERFFYDHPKLKARVIFLGPIDNRNELQQLYAKSKIFALPSAWESFGLVTVEAMSMGCFVIESDIDANIDVTENGKYGALFKSLNVTDFAKKLDYFLGRPKEMSIGSQSAYYHAKDIYNWDKVLGPVNQWIQKKA